MRGDITFNHANELSYIFSNEPRQHMWREVIADLGGGHVGVGADQNYSMMAAAKSRWGWIFDYDPVVIHVHHILHAVVARDARRKGFVTA